MEENKSIIGDNKRDVPKTVSIFTLGCKVNQYETQAIRELFEGKGYDVKLNSDTADIYIINTLPLK
jgi:tRNA A37 methylthiotransferase MiaB